MGKIRKDEAGFSAIEIVLVIVIVGLVGSVGYMVYKNHNKTTYNSTATANTAATAPNKIVLAAPAQPVDMYAGWKAYINTTYGISYKYPAV